MIRAEKVKNESTNPKAIDITRENYVFVRYSEIMDLRLKLNVVSTALLNLGDSLASIALMSTANANVGKSSAKLTGTEDINQNKPQGIRLSEPDAFGRDTVLTSKFTDIRLDASPGGQTKKSRKK